MKKTTHHLVFTEKALAEKTEAIAKFHEADNKAVLAINQDPSQAIVSRENSKY